VSRKRSPPELCALRRLWGRPEKASIDPRTALEGARLVSLRSRNPSHFTTSTGAHRPLVRNPALSSGRRPPGSLQYRAQGRAARGRTRLARHALAPGQRETRTRQPNPPHPGRRPSPGPDGAWPARQQRRWPFSSEARAAQRNPGSGNRGLAAQPQAGSHQARPDGGAQRAPTAGATGRLTRSTGLPDQPPLGRLGPKIPSAKQRQVLTCVHAHVTSSGHRPTGLRPIGMAYLHANPAQPADKCQYLPHRHYSSIANRTEMDWKWSKS
jgi:hypothetical protein